MKMNAIEIGLLKLSGLFVPQKNSTVKTTSLVTSINADFMKLGFIMSESLFEALSFCSSAELKKFYQNVLPHLAKFKGADVKYTPMYPNFPTQVMEADDLELFLNAIVHYWSEGTILPQYEKEIRTKSIEIVNYKEIGLITGDDFNSIFTKIVGSADSISKVDKAILEFFIENQDKNEINLVYPATIPFKENLCVVAGALLAKGKGLSTDLIKTPTDILRIATYLSGGDVSLAENTKFKNLPRSLRKKLTLALETVINEEDINRHRGKWVRLFHNLHVGEYSTKVFNVAKKFRNNEKVKTYASRVEDAFKLRSTTLLLELLSQRPGEFARRLDRVLRTVPTEDVNDAVEAFMNVADKLPTRLLLQIAGHFKNRNSDKKRVALPKGNMQRALLVEPHDKKLSGGTINTIRGAIENVLIDRFKSLDSLGNVWIDPQLTECPLPTQQRSASGNGFQTVARGTRLPIALDKTTLRFFIYWVGRDIDLSGSFLDEGFNNIGHISYTRLRDGELNACHSGDITNAPNGASEFIDIDIDSAIKAGARYAAMNVYVFSGPNFNEHDKCYAGWMTRAKPRSNELYDPKTVEHKVDLDIESRRSTPVVFDLVERKAIWTDLTFELSGSHYGYRLENVESSKASIAQVVESMLSLDNKSTLFELFALHAVARGTSVADKEDADTIFSLTEGITPYNIMEINSDFIVD